MNINELEKVVLALVDENEDQQKQITELDKCIDFLSKQLLEFQNQLSKK